MDPTNPAYKDYRSVATEGLELLGTGASLSDIAGRMNSAFFHNANVFGQENSKLLKGSAEQQKSVVDGLLEFGKGVDYTRQQVMSHAYQVKAAEVGKNDDLDQAEVISNINRAMAGDKDVVLSPGEQDLLKDFQAASEVESEYNPPHRFNNGKMTFITPETNTGAGIAAPMPLVKFVGDGTSASADILGWMQMEYDDTGTSITDRTQQGVIPLFNGKAPPVDPNKKPGYLIKHDGQMSRALDDLEKEEAGVRTQLTQAKSLLASGELGMGSEGIAMNIATLEEKAAALAKKKELWSSGHQGYLAYMGETVDNIIKGDEKLMKHIPQGATLASRVTSDAVGGVAVAYRSTLAGGAAVLGKATGSEGLVDYAKDIVAGNKELEMGRANVGRGQTAHEDSLLGAVSREILPETIQTVGDIVIGAGIAKIGRTALRKMGAAAAAKEVAAVAGTGTIVTEAITNAAKERVSEKAVEYIKDRVGEKATAIIAAVPGALEGVTPVIEKMIEADGMIAEADKLEEQAGAYYAGELPSLDMNLMAQAKALRLKAKQIDDNGALALFSAMAITGVTDAIGFDKILTRGGQDMSMRAARGAARKEAAVAAKASGKAIDESVIEQSAEKLQVKAAELTKVFLANNQGMVASIKDKFNAGNQEGAMELLQGLLNNASINLLLDSDEEVLNGGNALREYLTGFAVAAVTRTAFGGASNSQKLKMVNDFLDGKAEGARRANQVAQQALDNANKGSAELEGFGKVNDAKSVVKQDPRSKDWVIRDEKDVATEAAPLGYFRHLRFKTEKAALDFAKTRWKTASEQAMEHDIRLNMQSSETGDELDSDKSKVMSVEQSKTLTAFMEQVFNNMSGRSSVSRETFYAAFLQSHAGHTPEVLGDVAPDGTAKKVSKADLDSAADLLLGEQGKPMLSKLTGASTDAVLKDVEGYKETGVMPPKGSLASQVLGIAAFKLKSQRRYGEPVKAPLLDQNDDPLLQKTKRAKPRAAAATPTAEALVDAPESAAPQESQRPPTLTEKVAKDAYPALVIDVGEGGGLKPGAKSMPMDYAMAPGQLRPDLQKKYPRGTTTSDLFASGERTATTRQGKWKRGEVVQLMDANGVPSKQAYRVADVRDVDFSTPEGRKAWEDAEGWSADAVLADDKLRAQVLHKDAKQYVLAPVADPAPAPMSPPFNIGRTGSNPTVRGYDGQFVLDSFDPNYMLRQYAAKVAEAGRDTRLNQTPFMYAWAVVQYAKAVAKMRANGATPDQIKAASKAIEESIIKRSFGMQRRADIVNLDRGQHLYRNRVTLVGKDGKPLKRASSAQKIWTNPKYGAYRKMASGSATGWLSFSNPGVIGGDVVFLEDPQVKGQGFFAVVSSSRTVGSIKKSLEAALPKEDKEEKNKWKADKAVQKDVHDGVAKVIGSKDDAESAPDYAYLVEVNRVPAEYAMIRMAMTGHIVINQLRHVMTAPVRNNNDISVAHQREGVADEASNPHPLLVIGAAIDKNRPKKDPARLAILSNYFNRTVPENLPPDADTGKKKDAAKGGPPGVVLNEGELASILKDSNTDEARFILGIMERGGAGRMDGFKIPGGASHDKVVALAYAHATQKVATAADMAGLQGKSPDAVAAKVIPGFTKSEDATAWARKRMLLLSPTSRINDETVVAAMTSGDYVVLPSDAFDDGSAKSALAILVNPQNGKKTFMVRGEGGWTEHVPSYGNIEYFQNEREASTPEVAIGRMFIAAREALKHQGVEMAPWGGDDVSSFASWGMSPNAMNDLAKLLPQWRDFRGGWPRWMENGSETIHALHKLFQQADGAASGKISRIPGATPIHGDPINSGQDPDGKGGIEAMDLGGGNWADFMTGGSLLVPLSGPEKAFTEEMEREAWKDVGGQTYNIDEPKDDRESEAPDEDSEDHDMDEADEFVENAAADAMDFEASQSMNNAGDDRRMSAIMKVLAALGAVSETKAEVADIQRRKKAVKAAIKKRAEVSRVLSDMEESISLMRSSGEPDAATIENLEAERASILAKAREDIIQAGAEIQRKAAESLPVINEPGFRDVKAYRENKSREGAKAKMGEIPLDAKGIVAAYGRLISALDSSIEASINELVLGDSFDLELVKNVLDDIDTVPAEAEQYQAAVAELDAIKKRKIKEAKESIAASGELISDRALSLSKPIKDFSTAPPAEEVELAGKIESLRAQLVSSQTVLGAAGLATMFDKPTERHDLMKALVGEVWYMQKVAPLLDDAWIALSGKKPVVTAQEAQGFAEDLGALFGMNRDNTAKVIEAWEKESGVRDNSRGGQSVRYRETATNLGLNAEREGWNPEDMVKFMWLVIRSRVHQQENKKLPIADRIQDDGPWPALERVLNKRDADGRTDQRYSPNGIAKRMLMPEGWTLPVGGTSSVESDGKKDPKEKWEKRDQNLYDLSGGLMEPAVMTPEEIHKSGIPRLSGKRAEKAMSSSGVEWDTDETHIREDLSAAGKGFDREVGGMVPTAVVLNEVASATKKLAAKSMHPSIRAQAVLINTAAAGVNVRRAGEGVTQDETLQGLDNLNNAITTAAGVAKAANDEESFKRLRQLQEGVTELINGTVNAVDYGKVYTGLGAMISGLDVAGVKVGEMLSVIDTMAGNMNPSDGLESRVRALREMFSSSNEMISAWARVANIIESNAASGIILTSAEDPRNSNERAMVELWKDGFSPKPRIVATTLLQETGEPEEEMVQRGSLDLTKNLVSGLPTLKLEKGAATASTFVHETVHWLRAVKVKGGSNLMQEALGADDYENIMEWASEGVADDGSEESWRAIEEKIAVGVEAYFASSNQRFHNMLTKHPKDRKGGSFLAFAKLARFIRNAFIAIYQADPEAIPFEVLEAFDNLFLGVGAKDPAENTKGKAPLVTPPPEKPNSKTGGAAPIVTVMGDPGEAARLAKALGFAQDFVGAAQAAANGVQQAVEETQSVVGMSGQINPGENKGSSPEDYSSVAIGMKDGKFITEQDDLKEELPEEVKDSIELAALPAEALQAIGQPGIGSAADLLKAVDNGSGPNPGKGPSLTLNSYTAVAVTNPPAFKRDWLSTIAYNAEVTGTGVSAKIARAFAYIATKLRFQQGAPKAMMLRVIEAKSLRARMEATMERVVSMLTGEINAQVKQTGGSAADRAKARMDINHALNDFLSSPHLAVRAQAFAMLSPDLRDAAILARIEITKLSDDLINRGIVFGKLALTVGARRDYYLHHTFTIPNGVVGQQYWKDWLAKNPKNGAILARTIAEMRRQGMAMTDAEAQNMLDDKIDQIRAHQAGALDGIKGHLTAKEMEVMGEVLGLETDPVKNLINTMQALSQVIMVHEMESSIRDTGLAGGWIKDVRDRDPDLKTRFVPVSSKYDSNPVDPNALTRKGKAVWSPQKAVEAGALHGYTTSPEIAEFWQQVVKNEIKFDTMSGPLGTTIKSIIAANGIWRMLNTVYNVPAGGVKNAVGAYLAFIGTGRTHAGLMESIKIMSAVEFGDFKDPAARALIDKYHMLVEAGVAEPASLNELRDLFKYSPDFREILMGMAAPSGGSEISIKAHQAFGKAKKAVTHFYMWGDALFKMASFLAEEADLAKAWPNKSSQEISKMAAERVNDTMFSYEREPYWARNYKRAGGVVGIGNFFSFSYGMLRAGVNSFIMACKDIRQGWERNEAGDPGGAVQLAMGLKRFGGMFAMTVGVHGLVKAISWGFGWDEDKEKAAKELMPDYDRDAMIVFTSNFDPQSNELPTYFNLSNLLPFSYGYEGAVKGVTAIPGIIKALTDGDDKLAGDRIGKEITGTIMHWVQPFVDAPAWQKIRTLMIDGRDAYGRSIDQAGDDAISVIAHRSLETLKLLQPGLLKKIVTDGPFVSDEAQMFLTGNVKPERHTYHRMLSFLGFKPSQLDIRKMLMVRAGEAMSISADAAGAFHEKLTRPAGEFTIKEMEQGIDQWFERHQRAILLTAGFIDNAITLGADDLMIKDSLERAHVGSNTPRTITQENMKEMVYKKAIPMIRVTNQTLIKAQKAAELAGDKGRMSAVEDLYKRGRIRVGSGR